MNKKIVIIINIILLAVFSSALMGKNIEASDSKGSIEIVLKDFEKEGSDKRNVEFQIYQVGRVENGTTPIFSEEYQMGEYPQTAAKLDAAAKKLAGHIDKSETVRSGSTGSAGCVTFLDLEDGIYLVTAEGNHSYGEISPFLVQLPYYEEVNGAMEGPIYSVKVEPKASYTEPEEENPTPNKAPRVTKTAVAKTGDTADVSKWIWLMTGSMMLIVFSIRQSLKKGGDRK